MKKFLLLLTLALVLPLQKVPAAMPPAQMQGDFLSTPALSPAEVAKLEKGGKGVVLIGYANGAITEVAVTQASESPSLDRMMTRHILATFQLRPGASGSAKLPFQVQGPRDGDFISMPDLRIPTILRWRIAGSVGTAIVYITYQDGKVTNAKIHKTSGNNLLDDVITRHILDTFKLKSGASGEAALPINIHL